MQFLLTLAARTDQVINAVQSSHELGERVAAAVSAAVGWRREPASMVTRPASRYNVGTACVAAQHRVGRRQNPGSHSVTRVPLRRHSITPPAPRRRTHMESRTLCETLRIMKLNISDASFSLFLRLSKYRLYLLVIYTQYIL